MNVVRPILAGVVVTNIVNAFGNWVLVYGHLGVPALGVLGSAYATVAARVALAVFLSIAIVLGRTAPAVGTSRCRRDDRHGAHAGSSSGSARRRRCSSRSRSACSPPPRRWPDASRPSALAANQIVLNIAAFFFMMPFGLSSAAAVRVGQAVGRQDADGMRRAGWAALGLATAAAAVIALLFVSIPQAFLRLFTTTRPCWRLARASCWCARCSSRSTAFQAVATGALRGLGDTRTPMLLNLVGHWVVGLPLGYALCFWFGWGVVGLWAGLALSLIAHWRGAARRLARAQPLDVALAPLAIAKNGRSHDQTERMAGDRRLGGRRLRLWIARPDGGGRGGVSVDRANDDDASSLRGVAAGGVGVLDVHHPRHGSAQRPCVAGLHRRGRAVREGGRALRRRGASG